MGWKRPRQRWRKLPERRKPREGCGMHWGRYAKVPKVPGGPEIGFSTSGTVVESRPWSVAKWLLMLPAGIAAVAFFFPFLFTGPMWLVLAAVLIVLIVRTWRGDA